jgi:hypothetical protein
MWFAMELTVEALAWDIDASDMVMTRDGAGVCGERERVELMVFGVRVVV